MVVVSDEKHFELDIVRAMRHAAAKSFNPSTSTVVVSRTDRHSLIVCKFSKNQATTITAYGDNDHSHWLHRMYNARFL